MGTKRYITIITVVLLILCPLALRAETFVWKAARTRHFIVYYVGDGRSTAVRAGQIAEKWHAILSKKLDFSPGEVTPIDLFPDRRSFSEATGVPQSDSVVGMAHGRMVSISVDASGLFTDIERIIPHELVHVFVSRRLRGHASELPLWMHEGLAKYLAGDWTGQDAELLIDAATSGKFYPLSDISTSFPADAEGRGIAYVESYAVVRYMAKKYGNACIPELLSELAEGRSFDQAMKYSIGVEPAQFEEEWKESTLEEYHLGRWFRLISALIFPTMAVFSILAYRARRAQKRRKAKEFEEALPSETDELDDFR